LTITPGISLRISYPLAERLYSGIQRARPGRVAAKAQFPLVEFGRNRIQPLTEYSTVINRIFGIIVCAANQRWKIRRFEDFEDNSHAMIFRLRETNSQPRCRMIRLRLHRRSIPAI